MFGKLVTIGDLRIIHSGKLGKSLCSQWPLRSLVTLLLALCSRVHCVTCDLSVFSRLHVVVMYFVSKLHISYLGGYFPGRKAQHESSFCLRDSF